MRILRFGNCEAESSEWSVAVGFGAIELFGERTVEIEASTGERREGPTITPIECEKSAGFSGGGAGDGGFFDECDGGAALGEEVSCADSNDSTTAYDDSFRVVVMVHEG